MMSILKAGGINLIVDRIRTPDEDNPKGYFEFEKVKELQDDTGWINNAEGSGVKLVSKLLSHLPENKNYKIIFMKRDPAEMITSPNKITKRMRKDKGEVDDRKPANHFDKHLKQIDKFLIKQANMDVLYVSYNEVMNNPGDEIKKLVAFLKIGEQQRIADMVKEVGRGLYRNINNEDDFPGD